MQIRRVFLAFAAAWLLSIIPLTSLAQDWPTRPVRLVVPFPPGGGADVVARMLTQRLSARWGHSVIVDNRAGGNTVIGADFVARSPADGYTLLMAMDGTLTQNQFLFSQPTYDPIADFEPISLIVASPMAIIVNERFQGTTLADWVAFAKANPERAIYGVAGIPHQLISGAFFERAGVKATHVSYRGSAPTASGLMAGDVDLVFDGIAPYLGFIKQGRARVLAVTTDQRSSALPDVPTVSEAGWKGFDMKVWFGVVAPKGTPEVVLDRIQRDLAAVLSEPEIREKLATFAFEPVGSSRQQLAETIRVDAARYGPLIRQLGLKLD